jgi:ubiquinone/menaquinone biosynthesis C-methylase UbiE
VRRGTLSEALRVLKPGGQLVIVDYHSPAAWHPLRPVMKWILRSFEPFAMDLWAHEVAEFLPRGCEVGIQKTNYCAGLYQKLVITKRMQRAVLDQPWRP